MQDAFDRLRAATQTHDVSQIVKIDLEFHKSIVAMLNSSRIDDFYSELTRELHYYLSVLSVEDREYDRPEVVISSHEKIVTAIASGDPERAVQEVTAHLDRNAARLRQILMQRTG